MRFDSKALLAVEGAGHLIGSKYMYDVHMRNSWLETTFYGLRSIILFYFLNFLNFAFIHFIYYEHILFFKFYFIYLFLVVLGLCCCAWAFSGCG